VSERLLRVAVVGHTNTGKTSLMRTLLRDVDFGEVSDRPAVTREVEAARRLVDGQAVAELYDTPGLEDSIDLLDHLEALRGDRRVEGLAVVEQLLRSPAATGRFAPEAKAIGQVLRSDVALYVIDARDRVLGKHRDELTILGMCARPIVPVLNFTARPEARTATWREQLSRAGLHAVAEFDTVVLDELGEQRLYETMRTLLDHHRDTLGRLMEDARRQRERLVAASAAMIADLLVDAAAHRLAIPADPAAMGPATARLRDAVRAREQRCVEQLLELHRFRRHAWTGAMLPLVEGRWGLDLFSPAALKQFGVHVGGGAAAGAMAGLAVDLTAGGLTLGAGTAAGAAIGALLGAGPSHGRRLLDRLRGWTELRCDDATIRLLAARQVALVRALLRRGHAAVEPVRYGEPAEVFPSGPLPEPLQEARTQPQWSRLSGDLAGASGSSGEQARRALAAIVEAELRRGSGGSAGWPPPA
jgi:GTPase SAR1 family protein